MSLRFLFIFFGVAHSFALLSKNLQSIVNIKLMPSDLVKMNAVDPNWRGEGIFERITKVAGLFVHKDTSEIILETKHKLWTENEIIKTYQSNELFPNEFKNLIQTKDWNKLFFKSCWETKNIWRDALAEIIDVNGSEGNRTVLMDVVIHDATNFVKLLLEKGADANGKNSIGTTALHFAVLCHNIEAIKFLLKFNANINATDRLKETPLMKAVKGSMFDVVKLLLERGASLDLENIGGKTALDIAKDGDRYGSKNEKIIELLESQQKQPLLEFKTEINATDKSEETSMTAKQRSISQITEDITVKLKMK